MSITRLVIFSNWLSLIRQSVPQLWRQVMTQNIPRHQKPDPPDIDKFIESFLMIDTKTIIHWNWWWREHPAHTRHLIPSQKGATVINKTYCGQYRRKLPVQLFSASDIGMQGFLKKRISPPCPSARNIFLNLICPNLKHQLLDNRI